LGNLSPSCTKEETVLAEYDELLDCTATGRYAAQLVNHVVAYKNRPVG